MKILLCGMGNKYRGDDGFGSYVVENIHDTDVIKTIDCEIYPENYLNKIISFEPDVILFLDTIKKDGSKAILLKDEEILENNPLSISTHNLPFTSIYQYLKKNSEAHIWLLGIRPKSYERLTQETLEMAQQIISVFNSLDCKNNIDIIELNENLSVTLR
jgi:hydrogenase maturation protease